MILTIHQPEHLIWLGLVDKISQVDVFVIMDNVQFEKNNVQNRNKIRTVDGWQWLTVPVKSHSLNTAIKDINVSSISWRTKYLNALKINYSRAPFFDLYYSNIEKIIDAPKTLLADLNCALIDFILDCYGLNSKKIIRASDLNLPHVTGGSNACLQICKKIGADTYLSGPSGEHYLNLTDFSQNDIQIEFHKFDHPVYKQLREPFIPFMSSVDLLFNYGPSAKNILWDKNIKNTQ